MSQLQQLKSAVSAKNGKRLSELFALPVDRNKLLSNADEEVIKNSNGNSPLFFATLQDDNLGAIAAHRVTSIINMRSNNWSNAIDGALNMYNSLLEFLKEDNTVWILPVLVRLSNDIRLLAIMVSCLIIVYTYALFSLY